MPNLPIIFLSASGQRLCFIQIDSLGNVLWAQSVLQDGQVRAEVGKRWQTDHLEQENVIISMCNYRLTPCEVSCYKSEVLSGFFGSGCSDCCCRNGFREFIRDSRAYLRQIF